MAQHGTLANRTAGSREKKAAASLIGLAAKLCENEPASILMSLNIALGMYCGGMGQQTGIPVDDMVLVMKENIERATRTAYAGMEMIDGRDASEQKPAGTG